MICMLQVPPTGDSGSWNTRAGRRAQREKASWDGGRLPGTAAVGELATSSADRSELGDELSGNTQAGTAAGFPELQQPASWATSSVGTAAASAGFARQIDRNWSAAERPASESIGPGVQLGDAPVDRSMRSDLECS